MPRVLAIFDGHNDALTRDDHGDIATGRPDGHLDLPRMRAAGLRGGIFAIHTSSPGPKAPPVQREDGAFESEPPPVDHVVAAAHATETAGRLLALDRSGDLRVARATADLDETRANRDGPPLAVMHLEGAEAVDTNLDALDLWYAGGLRSLGPVWSRPNAFGRGVPFAFPSSPDIGDGLTRAGLALVSKCAELGILVDASHLNEAGFWDLARLELGPLVATHSGAHALCAASRNLTDRQLDGIGASGGLVGIVFACPFLRPDFGDDPDTPLTPIVEHARYVADRIGIEHVALGSDFDGAKIPRELGGVEGLPKLVAAFRDAGFGEAELEAIAWDNWRRVFGAWWRD